MSSSSSASSSDNQSNANANANTSNKSQTDSDSSNYDGRQWNVDICAAVIADKPPQLPLKEELPSLGFEVILGASGVGAKAAKYESQQAVEAYRKSIQYHDLQKRRLFPKCKRRIQEKIQARKQTEENLAVPHACSYESYEMRMLRARGRSMSRVEPTLPSIHDEGHSVGTLLAERVRNHKQVTTDFPDLLFLAPDHRSHSTRLSSPRGKDDFSSSKDSSSRMRQRTDYVPEVFGAFDNLDDDITSGRSGSIASPSPLHHDDVTAKSGQREQSTEASPGSKGVQQENEQKTLSDQTSAASTTKNPFDSALSANFCHSSAPSGGNASAKSCSVAPNSPCHASELFHREETDPNEELAVTAARISANNWMSSAKNVFDNISTEVLKVASCEKRNLKLDPTHSTVKDPISRLFDSLTASPDIVTIQSVLTEDPALAFVRREHDRRLPLHVLADQSLPFRPGDEPKSSLTDTLLSDINAIQRAVNLLVDAHPGACTEFDKKLDLPVHLMARRLMEWEATWYESIYHSAAQNGDSSGEGSTEVSELYHTMANTIDRLLKPLADADKTVLCQAPGGMGTILPLHVAAIFTVSVRTTRLILEAYPEAAKIPCDLGILQTFVPDECLAIELHDNLSTDYPKWELNQEEDGLATCSDEDRIRRSDLLFAYNPIEPHRFEKARISRFELQIQYDATILGTKEQQKLDAANEKVWLWMCSFVEPESGRATYANSVKRIIRSLTGHSFQHLRDLVVSTEGNAAVLLANNDCLELLQQRHDEINSKADVDPSISGAFCDTVEELCRLVFHVPDVSFPTSFVILPYKLLRSRDGSMSLENPEESSEIASRFAKFLIDLTEPGVFQDMLRIKWKRFDQSTRKRIPHQVYEKSAMRLNEKQAAFLALYRDNPGYLYILDRFTGLPDLQSFESENYPYALSNPAEIVALVFPLMMMGMLQMRGSKAVPKLIQICSDQDLSCISPSWIDAVERLHLWISAQPRSDVMESLQTALNSLSFVGQEQRLSHKERNFEEWSSELNALQTLIDALYHDQEKLLHPPLRFEHQPADIPSSPKLKTVSFVDDDVLAEDHTLVTDPPIVDVIDLTMKMDSLSEYQGLPLNANGGPTLNEDYSLRSSSTELLFSDEDERDSAQNYEVTDVTGLSDADVGITSSRYSPLFNTFAMNRTSGEDETEVRDEISEGIQVWNEIDRVWEEVEWQLSKRTETLCEDSQILQLKVDLAKQAKMLANLGKKVTDLRERERRFSKRDVEVADLTGLEPQSVIDGTSQKENPRSLFIRLGDLEERLVCDEIAVQHLSMESYTVEHEGDSMLSSNGRSSGSGVQQRPIPLPAPIDLQRSSPKILLQSSDDGISFSGDESSFRPYSRTSDQMVEIETSSSSYSRVRGNSVVQPSIGLDAVSRSAGRSSACSENLLRDPPGYVSPKTTQIFSIDSPRSVNERLLISRPFELTSTVNTTESSSKAQVSSMALTEDTIVGTGSSGRNDERSNAVSSERNNGTAATDYEERARRNLALLKKLSQKSHSDESPPLYPSTKLRLGTRAQTLAKRLRRQSFEAQLIDSDKYPGMLYRGSISQAEQESYDPTIASNASSIFRLETINVPQPFPPREYSGLTQSHSFNSRSDLVTEIDNLILRYTASDDTSNRVKQYIVS